jgi:hypothetical protein
MDSMAEDDDWWQIQHGSGAGSPPLMVLLMTADRMKDFRSGGYCTLYEENLEIHVHKSPIIILC